MQQIAVRGVDLEEFESRRQGAARGSLESRDDGIDAYAGRPIRGDESASCVPPRQDGHRDVYRLPSIQDRLHEVRCQQGQSEDAADVGAGPAGDGVPLRGAAHAQHPVVVEEPEQVPRRVAQ